MFEERYKALSSAEKKLFTSYVDELLFDSFIVRKKYWCYNKIDVGVKRCLTNCSVLRTLTILPNIRIIRMM